MPRVSSHWKMPVPLPRLEAAEALGQIERNDHADQPAAHALEQAAEEERAIAVGERNHGNAEDEGEAAEDHQRLAAHPVGEHAGKERGEDAAQQHGRDDDGELGGVRPEVASDRAALRR